MTRPGFAHSRASALIVLVLLATLGVWACAHGPHDTTGGLTDWRDAPRSDSATIALYRLDETAGITCQDDGPQRLNGTYGIDSRSSFGRFKHGRSFKASLDSWVYVPGTSALDFGSEWSVEAWVKADGFSPVECSVIAARWSPESVAQSWLVGLSGYQRSFISGAPVPPALFQRIMPAGPPGSVLVIIQPEAASGPRVYQSTVAIDVNRWTHVAATQHESVLRIYIDGRLDSQFAISGGVRASDAPLVLGNLIDSRWLTEAEGSLRVMNSAGDLYPFYAFEGTLDEIRISSGAR